MKYLFLYFFLFIVNNNTFSVTLKRSASHLDLQNNILSPLKFSLDSSPSPSKKNKIGCEILGENSVAPIPEVETKGECEYECHEHGPGNCVAYNWDSKTKVCELKKTFICKTPHDSKICIDKREKRKENEIMHMLSEISFDEVENAKESAHPDSDDK